MRRKVRENQILHCTARLFRCARPVRLEHDGVKTPKGLRHIGLVDEDIEARPTQATLGQRGDKRNLIDEAAARYVDQKPSGSERIHDLLVYDATRLRSTGRREN